MRNRAGGFSVGHLMEFLTALGQDVQITVRPAQTEHGKMPVLVRQPVRQKTTGAKVTV